MRQSEAWNEGCLSAAVDRDRLTRRVRAPACSAYTLRHRSSDRSPLLLSAWLESVQCCDAHDMLTSVHLPHCSHALHVVQSSPWPTEFISGLHRRAIPHPPRSAVCALQVPPLPGECHLRRRCYCSAASTAPTAACCCCSTAAQLKRAATRRHHEHHRARNELRCRAEMRKDGRVDRRCGNACWMLHPIRARCIACSPIAPSYLEFVAE